MLLSSSLFFLIVVSAQLPSNLMLAFSKALSLLFQLIRFAHHMHVDSSCAIIASPEAAAAKSEEKKVPRAAAKRIQVITALSDLCPYCF